MENQAAAAVPAVPVRARRTPVAVYGYLAIGLFTCVMNIQGNVLPFLRDELGLTYRVASLHTSIIAVGMITVGLFGERVVLLFGRERTLHIGLAGMIVGILVLAAAPSPWLSLPACLVIGLFGGFIPAIVYAVLADAAGIGRDQAYAEANAVAAAFALCAPASMSLTLALGLTWVTPLLLAAIGGATLLVVFWNVPVTRGTTPPSAVGARLPPAFWAYWFMLALFVAIEFCMFLWSPTFLEQYAGLSRAGAAGASMAFFVAMLLGRTVGAGLLRWISAKALLLAALVASAVGFVFYWSAFSTLLAVAGLFVTGLGVSLFFPLTVSLAVGSARDPNAASARLLIGIGGAIMIVPALLGSLADNIGLGSSLLVVPILIALGFTTFAAAGLLERQAVLRGA